MSQNQGVFLDPVCEAVKCFSMGCCSTKILQVNNHQRSLWMRNTLWCFYYKTPTSGSRSPKRLFGISNFIFLPLFFFQVPCIYGYCQRKDSDKGGTSCLTWYGYSYLHVEMNLMSKLAMGICGPVSF